MAIALPKKIMLLGSGELGKEVVIAAQRLGNTVIAVDRYDHAPAMQVADYREVISMLDGDALEAVVKKHQPDLIVPEVEAIRTEKLLELEAQGYTIIPTAAATNFTMNRDRIRDLASNELGLRTAKYAYASSLDQLKIVAAEIGFPNVIKPVMSSSGKGQSVVNSPDELEAAWDYAIAGGRGDTAKIIIEEFINFEVEITLLTIRQWQGETLFCEAIGHRQERGDYQESWQPVGLTTAQVKAAQDIARKVTDKLGGAGIFGVEFFITKDEVIFSELSPRPHDTGMVTLISQNLNEFELHLRAILGLPIPTIELLSPSASAVILANEKSDRISFIGVEAALAIPNTEIYLFGKPDSRPYRRMGVALAKGKDAIESRQRATEAASKVKIIISSTENQAEVGGSPEGHLLSLLQSKKSTEPAITFEEAIAYTENLLSRTDLDNAQLQSEITNLVKTANGARGFFVCFLTGEWELADNPSPAIIQALQAEPEAIAELLVKNLAMSTAMAITHRHNGNQDQAQGSDRVAKRTDLLIKKVDLPEVLAIAKQMQDSATTNRGEYAAFLEKWGYDVEQKQAIANVLKSF